MNVGWSKRCYLVARNETRHEFFFFVFFLYNVCVLKCPCKFFAKRLEKK